MNLFLLLITLIRKLWSQLRSLIPKIDPHKMQTWVVGVLFLIFFSAQLVLRHSDKIQVQNNTVKVASVEKKLDSIAIASRITDQIKSLEIKRMHRENRQLEQIIVKHDQNIRQIKKQLLL